MGHLTHKMSHLTNIQTIFCLLPLPAWLTGGGKKLPKMATWQMYESPTGFILESAIAYGAGEIPFPSAPLRGKEREGEKDDPPAGSDGHSIADL
jgi:hypothetical protein